MSNTGLLFTAKTIIHTVIISYVRKKTTGGCEQEIRRPCRFILGERAFGIYRISRVGEEKIYYYFLGFETPVVRPYPFVLPTTSAICFATEFCFAVWYVHVCCAQFLTLFGRRFQRAFVPLFSQEIQLILPLPRR